MPSSRKAIVLSAVAALTGILAAVCFGDAYEHDRFKGGNYEGYTVDWATNTTIKSAIRQVGTVILVQ